MNTLLIYSVIVATLGIDVGWQRLPQGGMEYIIQLDPQTLDALRAGQPIQSDIPPSAGEVRSYRITVGKAMLPRDTPLLTPPRVQPHTGQPAIFEEPESKAPAAKPQPPAATKSPPEESPRPWLPLTLTLLGLFGSLGANVYLGWIAWGFRQRCVLATATHSQ
jgi:hypothetical protein